MHLANVFLSGRGPRLASVLLTPYAHYISSKVPPDSFVAARPTAAICLTQDACVAVSLT